VPSQALYPPVLLSTAAWVLASRVFVTGVCSLTASRRRGSVSEALPPGGQLDADIATLPRRARPVPRAGEGRRPGASRAEHVV